jgi:hypothetical protein
MRLQFASKDEAYAAAGALIYAACNLSDVGTMPEKDQETIVRLNAMGTDLVRSTRLTPTQLKDLALRLVKDIHSAPD